MNSQMTVTVVQGGAALLVAGLGIAGAIAAQMLATRRAFQNSLVLLERQHAKQEQERQEGARREDAYRFAEQRRNTYGRFLRLARELVDAARTIAKNSERIDRQRGRWRPRRLTLGGLPEVAKQAAADARELKRRLSTELGQACEEIHLIASLEVRGAADRLWDQAHIAPHSDDGDYFAARTAFLDAVRHELGIVTE